MPQVHVICSQKGGVGKTTVAVNLAATISDVLGADPANPPVLVASIDPQASTVWWAEQQARRQKELQERTGRSGAATATELPFDYDQLDDRPDDVAKLGDDDTYDHILIDAPGSLARPAVLARAMEVASDVLVPVVPEPLAYGPTEKTVLDLVKPRQLPYRVVRNLWDRRDGRADLDALTQWLDEQELRYANTIIRRYKMHTNASAEGRVVTQYPPGRTAAEARGDFLALALEMGYGGQVTP